MRAKSAETKRLRPVLLCNHLAGLRCQHLQWHFRQIMQRLMSHPQNQGWFNVPVDGSRLGLSDYETIIKTPLDFGTIKSRVGNLYYSELAQFAADIRQVLCNATT